MLPLIYSATKKVLMILHDATLGTIACGACLLIRTETPLLLTFLVITQTWLKSLVECLVIFILSTVATTRRDSRNQIRLTGSRPAYTLRRSVLVMSIP